MSRTFHIGARTRADYEARLAALETRRERRQSKRVPHQHPSDPFCAYLMGHVEGEGYEASAKVDAYARAKRIMGGLE